MKKTILAIGAHPDDIEIGCGGTLTTLRNKGYELTCLVVTSGEEGNLSIPKKELADLREHEAKASAQIMGASQVHFLREPDGLTTFSRETKLSLISFIREIRPRFIFTHSSSDQFPDHRLVHQLTLSAVTAASGPWYAEAGSDPFFVEGIYGYEVWNPISSYQLAVDISSAIDKKIQALQAHESQMAGIDYLGAVKGLAKYRGVTTMVGVYAEVFEVLRARTL